MKAVVGEEALSSEDLVRSLRKKITCRLNNDKLEGRDLNRELLLNITAVSRVS